MFLWRRNSQTPIKRGLFLKGLCPPLPQIRQKARALPEDIYCISLRVSWHASPQEKGSNIKGTKPLLLGKNTSLIYGLL